MIFKIARITLALAMAGLIYTSAYAQTPQAAEMKKQAELDKKAAEAKKKADAKKPKNSDIENIGNRDINRHQINLISYEKEIALGRSLAADVDREVKMVEDPIITEYVNRVGQNIVRNSDAKVPFTIKVVESDEVNAFALPGGFFYVNSGLILAADDESELAGVMAHEIAHVTARHGAENQSKGTLINIATIPLMILGGPLGYGLRQASSFVIPLGFLKFNRGAETEADYLGVQYLYNTGYDPTASVSFFEKLQAKETAKPGTMNSLFRDHPPTGDRIESVKNHIEKILPDKEQYVVTTSEFNKVKMRLASLDARRPSEEESNKPSLRRKTPTTRDGDDSKTTKDDKTTKEPEKTEPKEDDKPPVLKRRP